ncbi:hypothetical protein H0H93_004517 [Arthromyces matolae]|nr:hypothetical protein H0H93_004517 [Arthromyces matolae]
MKDLATLRNPRSPITFLSYLQSQNRLVSFINRGSTIPSRKEYADYLAWAADYVQKHGINVLYDHEVVALSRGKKNSVVDIRCRNLTTGEQKVVRARDIVISPGGSPRIPESLSPIAQHPFVIHSSAYVTSIDMVFKSLRLCRGRQLRLAVIGSGQSAAEVTLDLRSRLSSIPSATRHEIDMIIRKGCLKPSDDSPFVNEIFDPCSTDTWFHMPSDRTRAGRLQEYKSTNYGVVNPRTLEVLHEIIYNQNLDEDIAIRQRSVDPVNPRINIVPYSSILSTSACSSGLSALPAEAQDRDKPLFSIITQNAVSRAISEVRYDAVICATGYQRSFWVDLIKESEIGHAFGLHAGSCSVKLVPIPSAPHSQDIQAYNRELESSSLSHIDENPLPDSVFISRNYQLLPSKFGRLGSMPSALEPRVYLQGVEEATHGISDTLLSVVGVRAGEVVDDLCRGRVENDLMVESKL